MNRGYWGWYYRTNYWSRLQRLGCRYCSCVVWQVSSLLLIASRIFINITNRNGEVQGIINGDNTSFGDGIVLHTGNDKSGGSEAKLQ